MKENNPIFGAILVIVGMALLVFVPMAIVWAIKTLFLIPIELTFETWCAALVLFGLINGSKR